MYDISQGFTQNDTSYQGLFMTDLMILQKINHRLLTHRRTIKQKADNWKR